MSAAAWVPIRLDIIDVPLSEVQVGDFVGYNRTRVVTIGRDPATRISVAITVEGNVTAAADDAGVMLSLIRPVFDDVEVSP